MFKTDLNLDITSMVFRILLSIKNYNKFCKFDAPENECKKIIEIFESKKSARSFKNDVTFVKLIVSNNFFLIYYIPAAFHYI